MGEIVGLEPSPAGAGATEAAPVVDPGEDLEVLSLMLKAPQL